MAPVLPHVLAHVVFSGTVESETGCKVEHADDRARDGRDTLERGRRTGQAGAGRLGRDARDRRERQTVTLRPAGTHEVGHGLDRFLALRPARGQRGGARVEQRGVTRLRVGSGGQTDLHASLTVIPARTRRALSAKRAALTPSPSGRIVSGGSPCARRSALSRARAASPRRPPRESSSPS